MSNIIVPKLINPSWNKGFARNASESAAPDLWKGKVGHWVPSLGVSGVNTLYDISGYGNHGTMNSSMTIDDWVIGKNGYALDFDGTDSVNLGSMPKITNVSQATISAIIRINSFSSSENIINELDWPNDYFLLRMDSWDSGRYYTKINSGGTLGTARINLSKGIFYYYVMIFDGNETGNNRLKIYIDGIQQSPTYSGTIPSTMPNTNVNFLIGSDGGAPAGLGTTFGNVRIYNRALTPSEIVQLYVDPMADLRLARRIFSIPSIVTNDVDLTLPSFTLNSTSLLHGTSDLNLPLLSVNATSAGMNDASITLPQFMLASTGLLHGTSSISLPVITINALSNTHADSSLSFPVLSVNGMGKSIHADSSLSFPVLSVNGMGKSIHADLSITLPQITTDFAGHNQVNGSISLPLLSLSGFSSPGIASLTLPLLTLTAVSGEVNQADITLPQLSVNATGLLHGNSSLSIPVLSVNALSNSTHADSSINMSAFSVNALSLNHGDSSITLPNITLNTESLNHGDIALTLPIFTVDASSTPTGNEASITLPIFTFDAQGHLAVDGNITLPLIGVSGGDFQGGEITLPIITLMARAVKGSIPDCVVMNIINNAVSEYRDYWFNSYAKFNGVYLAANQNGIYEQDESHNDNNGVDDFKIKSHIKTGVVDIDNDRSQRLRNAWLTYDTDGDIRIRSRADEEATRDYYLEFQDKDGIKERRVKFERGIRENSFDFKVENINGSDLEIEKLTVTLEPIISKRR